MFVRCFYPTFTSDSEWEQILGYGFDFPNGSNGMPGRVGKSRGRSLHGLMQSSQMMLRKWDIHPNFPEFLVLSTTRPRFSIIFHHFPSFSIIFHHFPQEISRCTGNARESWGDGWHYSADRGCDQASQSDARHHRRLQVVCWTSVGEERVWDIMICYYDMICI